MFLFRRQDTFSPSTPLQCGATCLASAICTAYSISSNTTDLQKDVECRTARSGTSWGIHAGSQVFLEGLSYQEKCEVYKKCSCWTIAYIYVQHLIINSVSCSSNSADLRIRRRCFATRQCSLTHSASICWNGICVCECNNAPPTLTTNFCAAGVSNFSIKAVV